MRYLLLSVVAVLVSWPAMAASHPSGVIQLAKSESRWWLVDTDGRPFFAHGVTHLAHGNHAEPVEDIAEAVKALGFNAYGYGTPEELKADLPYLDSRNHFVPISLYRQGDDSLRFVDIFDPAEQKRIEGIMRELCLANRDNPNLIGYCWTDLPIWKLDNPTGKNWVEFMRELPPDTPGRAKYDAFL
ncbi:MAG: beta-agarase, partial [Planctomycetota bacterium]